MGMEPTKYDRVKSSMASRAAPELPLGACARPAVDPLRHVKVRVLSALSMYDAEGECPWCEKSAYVHRRAQPDTREMPWRYVMCDGSIVEHAPFPARS